MRIIRTTTELAIHNERAEQMASSGLSTESIERLKRENAEALRRWESLPKNKRAHFQSSFGSPCAIHGMTEDDILSLTCKEAASVIGEALDNGNTAEATRVYSAWTKSSDYASRAHTYRVGQMFKAGLAYMGNEVGRVK